MFLSLRASTSRLALSSSHRLFSSSPRALLKAPLRESAETPLPMDLLARIGHNADKRLEAHTESWETLSKLWKDGTQVLKGAGLTPQDRKYVLWALARYSQGEVPSNFIGKPKRPKKIRR